MLREQLTELLEPVVRGLGYELWELEFAIRSNGGLLRLYIDSPHGISLDDCERVSVTVSERLDAADPIPGHYTLEVSSPGLDRVLRTQAHFAKYVGERVRVEMAEAVEGRKRFSGRLLDAGDHQIRVEVDGNPIELPIDAIHRARLVPEL